MPRKKEVKVRGVYENNPLSPDGSKSSGRVFSINSPRKWLAAARRKAEVKNSDGTIYGTRSVRGWQWQTFH